MELRQTKQTSQKLSLLALGALGVVYGDIGTSPLYALRECFIADVPIALSQENIFGVLSLIFWSLILVVSVKYILFILRADNRGEGGILALMALAAQKCRISDRMKLTMIIFLGLFGSSLLFGDGIITPAITVLGAVEGLKVATPIFAPYVVWISMLIIIALFIVQRIGSGRIGAIFGPIMLIWFVSIGILGLGPIIQSPHVLAATNPYYAIKLFTTDFKMSFFIMGDVLLVITGAEALYADMGHFGKRAIRLAWFLIALPGLLLNYFGQGALLMKSPEALENPFFHLAPSWAVVPLVILSTIAAIVASQALISGVFSLARQAIQLGFFPRLQIIHTSAEEIGQVYVPFINWHLLVATLLVVYHFENSSNLSGAYGLAVAAMMIITSILALIVARRIWGWARPVVLIIGIGLFTLDFSFLISTFQKFLDGGWFPIFVAVGLYTVMSTWKLGRQILIERLAEKALPLDQFLKDVKEHNILRVPGTAIFMTGDPNGTPLALIHNVKHNKVIHQRVIFMTARTEETPYVPLEKRIEISEIGPEIYRVLIHYGFQETPNIKKIMKYCEWKGLKIDLEETAFFVGRETLIPTRRPGMALWRERLFILMSKNAQRAASYFRIPSDKVVEVGIQVDL